MHKLFIFFALLITSACTHSLTTPDQGKTKLATPSIKGINLDDFDDSKHPLHKQYYSQCVSRHKNKNYLHLSAKCKCDAIQFQKLGYDAARDRTCDPLNLREGDQIIEQTSSCQTLSPISKLEIGMYIVEHKQFKKTGWQNGVAKRRSGLIWQIVSFNNEGVEVKLAKGSYYDYKVGDISPYKQKNSPVYRKAHPNATPNEQILQAYKQCINPRL